MYAIKPYLWCIINNPLNYSIMKSQSLISLFTGQCFIVGMDHNYNYYYSSKTENREWHEINEEIYNESFNSPLVQNIINL